MMRRLLMLGLLAAVVGIVVRSVPDIARYLKIREM
jgi:hypothetical protein